MIFNKTNLVIVDLTRTDKDIPVLDNVYMEKDGSSVASNGHAIVCVSPVADEMRENYPIAGTTMPKGAVVSSETVKEIIKNIPRDTRFGGVLENVELTVSGERAKFSLTDGKRRKEVGAKLYPYEYVDYKKTLARLHDARKAEDTRVVVHLDRFLAVLNALSKLTDKESPVYLEFTKEDDVLIRCDVAKTGQRVLAAMKSYRMVSADKWPELTDWERGLISHPAKAEGSVKSGVKKITKVAKIAKQKKTTGTSAGASARGAGAGYVAPPVAKKKILKEKR